LHGLRQWGYLYDYNYVEKFINHHYEGIESARISMDIFYAELTGLSGLLIGFVISLLLAFKFKWHWANSVIVLLIAFSLCCLDRFYWDHIKYVFMAPGRIFNSDWAYSFVNGLFMLFIGLTFFFLKWMINFIGINSAKNVKTITGV
jgi:hypothetical protein